MVKDHPFTVVLDYLYNILPCLPYSQPEKRHVEVMTGEKLDSALKVDKRKCFSINLGFDNRDILYCSGKYESVSKSFRTGCL
jgi:hypothetical protein